MQVFYSSTLFGAMTLAAAIDAGDFGARDDRRLLIVSNNAANPETATRLEDTRAFDVVRSRFDQVVSWNDVISPMHPAEWTPRAAELPMISRLLAARLGLVDVGELVVESIAVAPARTIATLIRDCPITVFSDGLMSYGPTRVKLPADIAGRIDRLLYLDLVTALRPLLLRETRAVAQPVADSAFEKVIAELPAPAVADESSAVGRPVIVGQYLSALAILSAAEEAALHDEMLRALVARGHRHVVFKPHPAAGREHARTLRATARQLDVRLTVAPDEVPAEAWFAAMRPELVVSCFSTALLTAAHYFDVPVAAMGTELALERIAPYQNSNRIPATIVDALVPSLAGDGALTDPPRRDIAALVQAVGYCMQARSHPGLRAVAVRQLDRYGPDRYFKRRRLVALGLQRPPLGLPLGVARQLARVRR